MPPGLEIQDTRRCTPSSCPGLTSSPNLRLGSSWLGHILDFDVWERQMFPETGRLQFCNSRGLVRSVRRHLFLRIRRAIVRPFDFFLEFLGDGVFASLFLRSPVPVWTDRFDKNLGDFWSCLLSDFPDLNLLGRRFRGLC